jgi:hypothetical protein
MDELLKMLKLSLGDLDINNTELDDYYRNKLLQAQVDLEQDDISESVLATDLGQVAICVYAQLLVQDKDIATNSTLTLLKNTLATKTKGERYAEWEEKSCNS